MRPSNCAGIRVYPEWSKICSFLLPEQHTILDDVRLIWFELPSLRDYLPRSRDLFYTDTPSSHIPCVSGWMASPHALVLCFVLLGVLSVPPTFSRWPSTSWLIPDLFWAPGFVTREPTPRWGRGGRVAGAELTAFEADSWDHKLH